VLTNLDLEMKKAKKLNDNEIIRAKHQEYFSETLLDLKESIDKLMLSYFFNHPDSAKDDEKEVK
jgi:hypothetical protein